MSETLIGYILNYISEREERKKSSFKRLLKWVDRMTYDFSKTAEDWEDYRKMFIKLKEIRNIYQKGKSFVNNQTKGKKKQSTPINQHLAILEFLLTHKGKNRAKEYIEKELKFFKDVYSERTYYRFKKEVKKLNLI